MGSRKDLSSELLRQNGLDAGGVSEDDRARFRRIIAREKAHVRRMEWTAAASWILVVAIPIAAVLVARALTRGPVHVPYFVYPLVTGLSCVAIYCSVSWFVRSRSLGRLEILAKLADIEAQLARLQPSEPPAQDRPPDARG